MSAPQLRPRAAALGTTARPSQTQIRSTTSPFGDASHSPTDSRAGYDDASSGPAALRSPGTHGAADSAQGSIPSSAFVKRMRADKTGETAQRFFSVPDGEMPLVVFINPKSGGKQGGALLSQFRKLFSDHQVFDMMEVDPQSGAVYGARKGLQMHGKVKNLSIVVCGGDGTVGWALSTIEELGLTDCNIRVGTVPLGTGNDLARSLKFGAGYSGQSALKLIAPLADCGSVRMDRWGLESYVTDATLRKKNYNAEISLKPPQQFWNNYFSIGSDAHTSLQFHLRREKNPKKFNSQWRNKLTYGVVGGLETLNTKFRKLSQELELVCDGVDYTAQLREKKIVALAFLNIHSYGAGTQPWGTKKSTGDFTPPAMDDGKVEVIGFWPWSFPKGQARVGHAWRICQCSEAEINLLSPNPMQIDGEACFLAASKIKLRWHSQATMLCHRQGRYSGLQPTLSAGVSPDSVLPERCEVYEVTIDTATLTASRLKRVGAIEWDGNREMDTLALSTIRRLIDAALPTFDSTVHRCGYNFLEFHKADPDAEGKYTVISSMVESETLCRTFLFPIGGVRAGVFIASRLPDDENDTIDVAADKLLLAASCGDWRGAIGYLESGVPPTVVDADGDTLVHLCAQQNMLELLTYLITHGVDCNQPNRLGDTPLHRASARGCTVACTMLLGADADLNARNHAGQTALDVSESKAVAKVLGGTEGTGAGATSTAAALLPVPLGMSGRMSIELDNDEPHLNTSAV
eukprot:m.150761 g.150761  ORF g.150761 m.150761 type:complete len:746 (-) comp23324_c0_seq4:4886-7123(-)